MSMGLKCPKSQETHSESNKELDTGEVAHHEALKIKNNCHSLTTTTTPTTKQIKL